jgi:signal transduction histidine kinase/ligand-binding sensor domain-containing protein
VRAVPVSRFRAVVPLFLATACLPWLTLLAQTPPAPGSEETASAPFTIEASTSEYFSRSWTVDEGLPNNVVNRLLQDRHGFLWIATGDGLIRFDGTRFKAFPLPDLAPGANSNIRDIAEDSAGNLVFLPGVGGILQLTPAGFASHAASSETTGKTLGRLFMEPDGAMWIASGWHDLLRWHEGRMETFRRGEHIPAFRGRHTFALDGRQQVWISGGDFLGRYENGRIVPVREPAGPNITIAAARSGGLWITAGHHLWKREDEKLRVVCEPAEWSSITQQSVQTMFEDRQGNLWVGTMRGGLFRLSANGIVAEPAPAAAITTILQDREDNIWVATATGGISMLRRKAFISLQGSSGLNDGARASICDDSTGALWWANRQHGLARYADGHLTSYNVPDTRLQTFVHLAGCDPHDTVWAATRMGIYTIDAKNPAGLVRVSPQPRDVRVLHCARNGDVWICSGENHIGYYRGGIYRDCSTDAALVDQNIHVIAEDTAGGIWVATGDRNLFQFSEGKFVKRYAGEQIEGGTVNGLLFDGRDNLWLATTSGLVMKHGRGFKRFGAREGLSDELVSQLMADDNGRLWYANRRGLCAVSMEELQAVAAGRRERVTEATLGRAEGLPKAFALGSRAPIPWKARDGRLWFSVHQGFVGVDPSASFPPLSPPPIHIDEIEVDKKIHAPGASLRLKPGDHQLTFRFSAVNFYAPEKVRLRHQLVGFDGDWRETGGDRSATYAQLRPGRYRMRVAAANQDGIWNEVLAPAAIVIPPAWWQTWTFTIAVTLLLILGFGWLVRHWSQRRLRARLEQLEREHQLQRERARIARDLHDELGYSVTQIGLIADRLKTEPALATIRDGLGELASCTRRLSGELEGVVWTVSPKNDQWNRLASYIRQFSLNFFADTPITCTVEGVDSAPAAPLAPEVQHHLLAIVKEVLNNTLKHARATRVQISMSYDERRMLLRIADNGTGFDPAAMEHSERNGLTNLRARADEIGASMEIDSAPGRGTAFTFDVPFRAVIPPRSA